MGAAITVAVLTAGIGPPLPPTDMRNREASSKAAAITVGTGRTTLAIPHTVMSTEALSETGSTVRVILAAIGVNQDQSSLKTRFAMKNDAVHFAGIGCCLAFAVFLLPGCGKGPSKAPKEPVAVTVFQPAEKTDVEDYIYFTGH